MKCVPNVGFSSQSDAVRMAVRRIVESHGGTVDGYYDRELQVAMPFNSSSRACMLRDLREANMTLSHSYYFPLGSDSPPDTLRHDASYPGSRGYWMYSRFQVATESDVILRWAADNRVLGVSVVDIPDGWPFKPKDVDEMLGRLTDAGVVVVKDGIVSMSPESD